MEPGAAKMQPNAKIYVAGHHGMAGSAIERDLEAKGCSNILTCPKNEFDLLDKHAAFFFLEQKNPDYIFNSNLFRAHSRALLNHTWHE